MVATQLACNLPLQLQGDPASRLRVESLYGINCLPSSTSSSMSFPIYSIRDHLAAGRVASFQQDELIKELLAHEASNLSGTMLEQLSEGSLR